MAHQEDEPPEYPPDHPPPRPHSKADEELARELRDTLERHAYGFVGSFDGSPVGNARGGPMTTVDAEIDMRAAATSFAAIVGYQLAEQANKAPAKTTKPTRDQVEALAKWLNDVLVDQPPLSYDWSGPENGWRREDMRRLARSAFASGAVPIA